MTNNNDLTPMERVILDHSRDLAVTRRRRTTVVVTGLTTAMLLAFAAYVTQSWMFALGVSLVYITVTIAEKVAYANAVLSYKRLIQKLNARVEELEKQVSFRQPPADHGSLRSRSDM